MSKPLLGIVLGSLLGIFDGLSALVSAGHDPKIRAGIIGIVIGSTLKGVIAGIAIGYFSRKFNSLPLGLLFGLVVGAILAYLVAMVNPPYFWEIVIPGSLVGLILGYATQRYGTRPLARPAN